MIIYKNKNKLNRSNKLRAKFKWKSNSKLMGMHSLKLQIKNWKRKQRNRKKQHKLFNYKIKIILAISLLPNKQQCKKNQLKASKNNMTLENDFITIYSFINNLLYNYK